MNDSLGVFDIIFELSMNPKMISDPETGYIIKTNKAFSHVFGYDTSEFLNNKEANDRVWANPGSRESWFKMVCKDGQIIDYCDFLKSTENEIKTVFLNSTIMQINGSKLIHTELNDITDKEKIATSLQSSISKLQTSMQSMINVIALTVETKDPYTAGHQRRVSILARETAKMMKLPDDRVEGIRIAAFIHDLGKIAIPVEILSKPGKLSAMEFELIKTHSQRGYDILRDIDFAWPLAEIVYQHHERLDGSGYPKGLKGDEILLDSKILCVADVVEAIASNRPYRPALGRDIALKEINEKKGSFYDPEVVDACTELLNGNFEFEY